MYKFTVFLFRLFMMIFNGLPIIEGLTNIPKDRPVIFASTHRSNTDPVYLTLALRVLDPDLVISFMAKDTLFSNPLSNWFFRKVHAFPVDRDNPGTKVIREAVNKLTKDKNHLGIFPTGSRYSTEVKGGTALIQSMSKCDIIPVAIQPPIGAKELFSRKKCYMAFGKPIKYDPNAKYNREKLNEVDQQIQDAFDELDQQLNPDYIYIPPKRDEDKE